MLMVTPEELSEYSKRYPDEEASVDLRPIYIGSAQDVIENYLGYDIEERHSVVDPSTGEVALSVPTSFRLVCLQIATLMYMTENSNLGYASSSSEGGTGRVFLNVVDYTKYLSLLSPYRDVPSESGGEDGE